MKNFISVKRANVLFITGVLMLIFAGFLWWANGGYMKTEKTNAAWSACTDGGAGCFTETWKAEKALGHVYGYFDDEPRIGTRVTCVRSNGTYKDYFAVPGTESSNGCNNRDDLKSAGTVDFGDSLSAPVVITDWKITGEIQQ